MPPNLLRQVADEMAARDSAFARKVEGYEQELYSIFDAAERDLVTRRTQILSILPVDEQGRILKGVDHIDRIDRQVADIRDVLAKNLVEPGRGWADQAVNDAFRAGRMLARANVSHGLIDFDAVRLAFETVHDAEAGVLRVGLRETYDILRTSGDDIAAFFRQEMVRAATLGLPVQGPGSLAERLFESGRIKPITVRTKDGKIVHRTVRQRAVSIARIETAKVYNREHQVKAEEIFGAETVYVNINPRDHRTTPLCEEASRQPPMTMLEWERSKWGLPPRLDPFHLCRSHLLGATRELFERYGYPVAA